MLLFDNNEDGGKQAADVRDFIADGFLSYYQIQGDNLQLGVYDICVEKARTQFAWLAAIDLDEFLVVKDEALRLEAKPLKRLMAQFHFKTGTRPSVPLRHQPLERLGLHLETRVVGSMEVAQVAISPMRATA